MALAHESGIADRNPGLRQEDFRLPFLVSDEAGARGRPLNGSCRKGYEGAQEWDTAPNSTSCKNDGSVIDIGANYGTCFTASVKIGLPEQLRFEKQKLMIHATQQ